MHSIPYKSVAGATLLITGCCIGAAMIGLPLKSALAGFIPSTFAMILCYLFTTISGLFIVEATLWFDGRVNLSSIVECTLGKKAKLLALFLFLTLFYSLFVAYMDGCGIIFADILSSIVHYPLPKSIGIITCSFLVAMITYAGTHCANRFNHFLMIGLIVTYCLLVILGLSTTRYAHTTHMNMLYTLNVIPILLIGFGYQNLVPSIIYYLEKNINFIRFAIIVGNMIPLFIYLLWNYIILGIITPDQTIIQNAAFITQLLSNTVSIISIVFLVKSFSLFAMLTSFIPNAISLVDFIKDAIHLNIKPTKDFMVKHELMYLGLIFIPSFLFTIFYPNLFLNMLDFAGGFIDVLLFGILPAMVILTGRRVFATGYYRVSGGIITPILMIVSSLFILLIKLGLLYV